MNCSNKKRRLLDSSGELFAKRTKNVQFSSMERAAIANFVQENQSTLMSTDRLPNANARKLAKWEELADFLTTNFGYVRTVETVKKCWQNMCSKAKYENAALRNAQSQTVEQSPEMFSTDTRIVLDILNQNNSSGLETDRGPHRFSNSNNISELFANVESIIGSNASTTAIVADLAANDRQQQQQQEKIVTYLTCFRNQTGNNVETRTQTILPEKNRRKMQQMKTEFVQDRIPAVVVAAASRRLFDDDNDQHHHNQSPLENLRPVSAAAISVCSPGSQSIGINAIATPMNERETSGDGDRPAEQSIEVEPLLRHSRSPITPSSLRSSVPETQPTDVQLTEFLTDKATKRRVKLETLLIQQQTAKATAANVEHAVNAFVRVAESSQQVNEAVTHAANAFASLCDVAVAVLRSVGVST